MLGNKSKLISDYAYPSSKQTHNCAMNNMKKIEGNQNCTRSREAGQEEDLQFHFKVRDSSCRDAFLLSIPQQEYLLLMIVDPRSQRGLFRSKLAHYP